MLIFSSSVTPELFCILDIYEEREKLIRSGAFLDVRNYLARLDFTGTALPEKTMDSYDSDKILPLTTVTKLGLKTNKAALLCYVPLFGVNLVAPAVWLISEPKNNYFLRFHSTQALVLASGYVVLAFAIGFLATVFSIIPLLGHLVAGVLGLLGLLALGSFIITNCFLMYAGYNNRLVKLPLIGEVADKVLSRIDNK
jgi:uncharacterized membrane protein